jgi:hypothetical protein
MTTMRKLSALAEKMGATIEQPEGDTVLYAWAPEGAMWDVTTATVIAANWDEGTKADAIAFLMSEMREGHYPID